MVIYFLITLLVATTAWGQYWYDKARRQADAIAFMIEQEVEDAE
jgi:hypothetical protein